MEDESLPYLYFHALARTVELCVNLAPLGVLQSGNLYFFFFPPRAFYSPSLSLILNLYSIPAKCQDP